MTDFDRFSDEYDPEPDYDRPTRAEAEADAAEDRYDWLGGFTQRPPRGRIEDGTHWSQQPETCEDRDYRCCELTPMPASATEMTGEEYNAWYDRHLAAWRAQEGSEKPGEDEDEYVGPCPLCGALVPPDAHADGCPVGPSPDDVGEDF
jgi:hypothetical protein